MDKSELQKRFKVLAVRTAKLSLKLPFNSANKVYTDQVTRSSASSANYRAACRAKSKADFINKLKTVEEELDKTMFFYEMIAEFNPGVKKELKELFIEANELLSIIVASINTSNSNIIIANARKIRNPESKI
ncbi:MAG TPA: four helix bundle protein [Chitinophagaceae bacterium]|nr:four helix bundle protein [Chitinophagaceae bacterium]